MTELDTPTRPRRASAPDFDCGWSLTQLLGALSLQAGEGERRTVAAALALTATRPTPRAELRTA